MLQNAVIAPVLLAWQLIINLLNFALHTQQQLSFFHARSAPCTCEIQQPHCPCSPYSPLYPSNPLAQVYDVLQVRHYAAKELMFGVDCRAAVLSGVEKLADAVQVTLGPKVGMGVG